MVDLAISTARRLFYKPAQLGPTLWLWVALALAVIAGYAWLKEGLDSPFDLALVGGFAAALATGVGALPAALIRTLNARTQDVMLGFGAGVMLAASSFSLILPGVAAATDLIGNKPAGALVVVIGLGVGAAFMIILDRIVPHEHAVSGRHGLSATHLRRVWLMVFAIALHNFPEGMAIGVSFSNVDLAVAIPLTTAIAIQDIPEGLVVAIALRSIAYSPLRAALIGAATGLVEPLGAALGVALTGGSALFYPVGLGLAAGAMIWVVSHEVIPETHQNGHAQPATLGLMGGFAVMLLLDTALG